MSTGTLPRLLVYSELYIHVVSKYSCFNFGTFYTVDRRILLTTGSLSWKDKISGHSESSTCVLSKRIALYCGSFKLFCNAWVCGCLGFVICFLVIQCIYTSTLRLP